MPFQGDLTQILTDSASHFMRQTDDRPFFCMLTYQAPHTPVQVADEYWEVPHLGDLSDYNRGIYAMIESIDDRIGQLLDELEEAGKLDNTIVIFSTDNGPNGDRYRMGLKGTKGHVDEGGVRVPFAIRLPDNHPANGSSVSTPAAHIDLLPTLLDYLELPAADGIDGLSLLPLLEGGELADRYVYTFKQGYDYTGYPGSMRDSQYLYVAQDSASPELYDLANDPGQRRNIYATQTNIGQRMATIYHDFATAIGRPELVAPPIDLDAAPGEIRLLAHEGEPLGKTRFMDEYGWANDFFVDLNEMGAEWPVTSSQTATYTVTVEYHLAAAADRSITLRDGRNNVLQARLSPALTKTIPVADRVPRKEVYPRNWAKAELGTLRIASGAQRLNIASGGPGRLWIRSINLRNTEGNSLSAE